MKIVCISIIEIEINELKLLDLALQGAWSCKLKTDGY